MELREGKQAAKSTKLRVTSVKWVEIREWCRLRSIKVGVDPHRTAIEGITAWLGGARLSHLGIHDLVYLRFECFRSGASGAPAHTRI
jgi:hypothetical protein